MASDGGSRFAALHGMWFLPASLARNLSAGRASAIQGRRPPSANGAEARCDCWWRCHDRRIHSACAPPQRCGADRTVAPGSTPSLPAMVGRAVRGQRGRCRCRSRCGSPARGGGRGNSRGMNSETVPLRTAGVNRRRWPRCRVAGESAAKKLAWSTSCSTRSAGSREHRSASAPAAPSSPCGEASNSPQAHVGGSAIFIGSAPASPGRDAGETSSTSLTIRRQPSILLPTMALVV